MKIHLFDISHSLKFNAFDTDRYNATKCGYVRQNITHKTEEVTCKLCLREIKKEQERKC
jgi:hypothetical protein